MYIIGFGSCIIIKIVIMFICGSLECIYSGFFVWGVNLKVVQVFIN